MALVFATGTVYLQSLQSWRSDTRPTPQSAPLPLLTYKVNFTCRSTERVLLLIVDFYYVCTMINHGM